jgi:hypothetical protein
MFILGHMIICLLAFGQSGYDATGLLCVHFVFFMAVEQGRQEVHPRTYDYSLIDIWIVWLQSDKIAMRLCVHSSGRLCEVPNGLGHRFVPIAVAHDASDGN